ncbi:40983_t:CDS:2, partial [Gigaspora margarita]
EDIDLEEKAAEFNNWYHDTDDWPIEETISASEGWPKLVTESETNMWNLPDPYTWKTSTNEPELLPAIVPTETQFIPTIPYPNDSGIPLLTRVTKTYTKLLSVGSRKRKRQLVYAYYLGELLQEEPETPEELRACRRKITAYYYKGAIRTYNIFKDLE